METRIRGVLSPKPSGSITITENGNYDVVDVANAVVDVRPSGTIEITENGEYDVANYEKANVQTKRSLKTLLDAKKSANRLFDSYQGEDQSLLVLYDDFENVEACSYTFFSNPNMIKAPHLNTKKCTNFDYCFQRCTNLKDTSGIDFSNGKSFRQTFQSSGIEKSPDSFKNFKNTFIQLNQTFASCTELTDVEIDCNNINNLSNFIQNCEKITNLTLYNIKIALQIASGTSYGHLITKESLIQIIGELIDTGSNKTLTIGSANLSKLTDVYVKITSTDADENGNVKLPFEVCNASDEGAMLITNYVTQKHWSLS